MKTIYKYEISREFIEGSFAVPDGYKILHFDMQGYVPVVWMEVDPSEPEVLFHYSIVGTGWKIPGDEEYIGTCLDGPYVWHLYRRNI